MEITPIMIYMAHKKYRFFLRSNHIVNERDDGTLFIPGFDCRKTEKTGKFEEKKNFPFFHQLFIFELQNNALDVQKTISSWLPCNSYFAPSGNKFDLITKK